MADAKTEELRRLVAERLQNESTENLVGLGTVFGLDRDSVESATPLQRVQMLMDGIELAQLADILEIQAPGASTQSPAATALPPPPPESEILAQVQASSDEPFPPPRVEEATFPEDLQAPATRENAPEEVDSTTLVTEETTSVPAAASPEEEPPGESQETPAPGSIDAMTAEMLASGELTEEELAQLREEAGETSPKPKAREVDEIDVLQQLRSVRKDRVQARDKEKAERKRRREAATKAVEEPPPPDKLQVMRLWLFRTTLIVLIVLTAMRSEVIILTPDRLSNVGLLIQIKLTGTGTEKVATRFPPPVADQPPVRPVTTGTTGQQPPSTTPQLPPVEPPSPDRTRAFLERELRAGDLQGTIDLAARSFDVSPDKVKEEVFERAAAASAGIEKGLALMLAQDLPGAESVLREISGKAGAEQARAAYLLGQVRRLQGRPDEARDTFRQAVAKDPKMAEALHGIAELEVLAGRLPAAEDLCRQAIAARPEYVDAYYSLADLQKQQGRTPDAIATYQKLLAKQPRQSYALFSIGLIEFKQGNPNGAAEKFRKAIEANAGWRYADAGLAWNNLANCLDAMGKPAEALKAHEAAARARPDDDLLQYNLARAYQKYEYPDKAIRPYERAVELMQLKEQSEIAGLYVRAIYNLGDCYMQVHNFRMAAERYDEVLRLKPETESAREKLERALEAQERARLLASEYGTPTVARTDRPQSDEEAEGPVSELPKP